jgi:hypothetical protein
MEGAFDRLAGIKATRRTIRGRAVDGVAGLTSKSDDRPSVSTTTASRPVSHLPAHHIQLLLPNPTSPRLTFPSRADICTMVLGV